METAAFMEINYLRPQIMDRKWSNGVEFSIARNNDVLAMGLSEMEIVCSKTRNCRPDEMGDMGFVACDMGLE
jgi:hypothetical protein